MKLKGIIYIFEGFLILMLLCIPGGCSADLDDYRVISDGGLQLSARVCDTYSPSTRASQTIVKEYVNHEDFPGYFYIFLNATNTAAPVDTAMGIFQVSSGVQGRLDDVNTAEPMNWKDIVSPHTFYSWYLPWLELPEEEKSKYAVRGNMNINPYSEGVNLEPLYIQFFNSPEISKDAYKEEGTDIIIDNGDNFKKWQNNAIYDKFIGARSGPWDYKTHGEYVELTHYHLVSQIRLDTLTLITLGQTIQNNVKGEITLYNIPTAATFYPYPEAYKDIPGIKGYPSVQSDKNGGPIVIAKPYTQTDTLCFYLDNMHTGDYMYIPPETDFSNVSYKVTLKDMGNDDRYSELGAFYGTFNDIEFIRDNQNLDNINGNDSKILHAGEMMSLRIFVYPDGGGGLITVRIEPWSVQKPSEAEHHSHAGVYTSDQAQSFQNAGINDDVWANLFELYGKEINGKDVFYLYENVTVTGSTFNIPDPYIFDGNDHLLTMGVSNNKISLQNVRNVYIKAGNYLIYVDVDGNVYHVNPSTFEKNNEPFVTLSPSGSTTITLN